MAKRVNVKKVDPEHFAVVKAQQDALKKELTSPMEMVRKCPYCGAMISAVPRGNHTYITQRCPDCDEWVTFPPLSFRIA